MDRIGLSEFSGDYALPDLILLKPINKFSCFLLDKVLKSRQTRHKNKEQPMVSNNWQLQDAKNRFSDLVRRATEEGPQMVTKHGKISVVVMSIDDFKVLEKPSTTLVDFFRSSPASGVDIDISRDKVLSRDVSL
jgi:prevent-host-death family protein